MTINSPHYVYFSSEWASEKCLSASSSERNSFAQTLLVPGVIESIKVNGVYDIYSLIKLKGTITRH